MYESLMRPHLSIIVLFLLFSGHSPAFCHICEVHELSAKHTEYIKRIRELNFTAKVTSTFQDSTNKEYVAFVAQNSNKLRLFVTDANGSSRDVLISNNKWHYSIKESFNSNQTISAGIMHPRDGYLGVVNPYSLLLLQLDQPGQLSVCNFEQLLDRSLFSEIKLNKNGDAEVTLEFSESNLGSNFKAKVIFCKNNNWLIKSYDITGKALKNKADLRYTYMINRFSEVEAGYYFPTDSERQAYVGGILSSSTRTEVTSVTINQPLDQRQFDFKFPQGIICFDEVLNKKFIVPASGKLHPIKLTDQTKNSADRITFPPPQLDVSTSTTSYLFYWVIISAVLSLSLLVTKFISRRHKNKLRS